MKLILPTEIAATIEPHLRPDAEVVRVDHNGNLDGDASNAEIFLNWFFLKRAVLDKVLAAAPNIRWQHTPSAGTNHLLTPLALSRDMILTSGAGVHAIPVAEFVLAFMLNHAKLLRKFHEFQAQRDWQQGIALQELAGATVLIIGAGGIGQAIAQRASAFGMRVWGSRQRPKQLPNFERIVGATEWRSLLPEADYVVIATPLTPETKGMIDVTELQSMHSSAYLINIARGAIVDEAALLTALTEGWIAGAGIDTFATEPLPPDSPFWTLPNIFITSHSSGSSPRSIERSVDLFLDNLNRYQADLPLRNVVNRSAGY